MPAFHLFEIVAAFLSTWEGGDAPFCWDSSERMYARGQLETIARIFQSRTGQIVSPVILLETARPFIERVTLGESASDLAPVLSDVWCETFALTTR